MGSIVSVITGPSPPSQSARHVGASYTVTRTLPIPAPYPALVTIGHDPHGAQTLIDLAAVRELSVTGSPTESTEILRALAIELAAAQLADDLCLTLVGYGHELARTRLADGARLKVTDDLDAAIDELAAWARTQTTVLQAHSLLSPRHARADQVGPDAWTPRILLTAVPPDDAQAAKLAAALAAKPRANVAAVTTRQVTLDAWIPDAAPNPCSLPAAGLTVSVQRIDEATYQQLVEHLAIAEDASSAGTTPPIAKPPFDEPAHSPAAAASTAEARPPVAVAEPEAETAPDHPEVRILGPVEIAGTRGECEAGKQTRLTEIAAWLVLHPGRDHRAITKAIWPLGTTTNNRNPFISKLRSWLGNDDNDQPYLPLVGDAGYLLSRQVRCDWLRFRHLAHRSMQRGGAADVTAALRLVRGTPFTVPVGGTRYAWAEPPRQHITSAIVDAAAWLAEHHLGAREWRAADTAAQSGLRAVPGAEQLWRLRFQALDRVGDSNALNVAIIELECYNEANGLDMEPETDSLLAQLSVRAASA